MAAPKGGYFGKILEVDLTTGKTSVRAMDDAVYRDFIGGEGLGAYILYKELPPKTDPTSPQNLFLILPGPLNATSCIAGRLNLSFKSPHTGLFAHTQVGGPTGNEFKFAGWDAVIVKGKSPKPVYLVITNDKAELRDAAKIWGKDTFETDEMIKEDLGDDSYKTMVIGPAGENGVPYACVIVDRFRAAGRAGGGAVMGSKNLKAVAVKGTKAVPVANLEAFNKLTAEGYKIANGNPALQRYKSWGTAASIEGANFNAGSLVAKNYQTSWYPDVTLIGAEEASRTFWKRHVSCPNCPVHCMKVGVLRTGGKYDGLIAEGPEYETGVLMGSNLGATDFDVYMKSIEECDALGLDTISTGNSLGFVYELMERGLLKPEDLDGVKPTWGDSEAAITLTRKIAYKEGKAGKFLALGVKRMADKVGGDAHKYAIHCKGNELAAHEPRGFKPRAYSYAMGMLGGDHHEGNSPEEQVQIAWCNSAVLCTFPTFRPWGKRNTELVCQMLNTLCGWDMKEEDYWTIGKRIISLIRVFNVREAGVSRKDDVLPIRMRTEPLPEGPKKGQVFTDEDTKKMQDSFYAYFAWDDNGIPTEETLKKLKLDFAVADIKKK